jgi:hypothetical protein
MLETGAVTVTVTLGVVGVADAGFEFPAAPPQAICSPDKSSDTPHATLGSERAGLLAII